MVRVGVDDVVLDDVDGVCVLMMLCLMMSCRRCCVDDVKMVLC